MIILFIRCPSPVSDVMDHFYSLSAYRFVPEVVSSGPAGGQLVPQFPVSREDNEVIQLYTGQQSPSAPYIHARHVVRRTQTELRARFHARRCTDVLGFVEQKARGRGSVWTNSKALWMTATRPCCSDTLKLKDERTSLNIHSLIRQEKAVLCYLWYVYLMIANGDF